MSLNDLIQILQLSIGPVILISGVGLLLLTFTNRFGRIIDFSRRLSADVRSEASEKRKQSLTTQLQIQQRRARVVRLSIIFAGLSALLAALLIITLFMIALLQLDVAWIISVIFSVCMLSLIAGLVLFIADVNISLNAIKLEISETD